MLSTFPFSGPLVLAPEDGGTLLCLWLRSHAETLLVCETLRQLVVLPSCGVQTWPRTNQALFVVCALKGQADILRGLLSAFGSVTDWPSRLKVYGDWSELGGQPTYADREYVEAAA
jgi:hypothetical protein